MSREYAPQPGAHWDTRTVAREQVVPDTTGPDGNEPLAPRLNRRQRRAEARANRQKGHR